MSISKIKELADMVEKYKHLPVQGSDEWLEARTFTIGGSEIATLAKLSYSNYKTLLAYKLGIKKFISVPPTIWGKLMEPLTTALVVKIFNIPKDSIAEFGSLPGIHGQSYSPDGVGVVKLKLDDDTYEYFTVLFEYKSPITSITNGTIPTHYMPQVKTGLCTIDIADFALFISNVYRKCSLEDLGFNNEYDNVYHKKDKQKDIYFGYPLAIGIILIYQSDEENIKMKSQYDDPWYDNIGNIIIDFGAGMHFDKLLYLYENKMVNVEYCDCIITPEMSKVPFLNAQKFSTENPTDEDVDQLKKLTDKDNVIGYVPWKLFKSDIVYQDRDPEYVNNLKPEIEKFIKDIHELKGSDMRETVNNFNILYPNDSLTDDFRRSDIDYIRESCS